MDRDRDRESGNGNGRKAVAEAMLVPRRSFLWITEEQEEKGH